jgi:FKBP-type peptidyl-prolyl cis-trans isomerase FklB
MFGSGILVLSRVFLTHTKFQIIVNFLTPELFWVFPLFLFPSLGDTMHPNKLHLMFILAAALLTQPAVAKQKAAAPAPEKPPVEEPQSSIAGFKSNSDAISYAVGASIGRNFKKDAVEINQKIFLQGLEDASTGKKLKMTEKEFKSVMTGFQAELRQKAAADRRDKGIQNQKKSDDFLAENGKKPDVVTLPSGVQYKIIKAGDGQKPVDSDMVEVNYRGTLLDGTEFDASVEGKPATLKLAALIAGWKEVLKLMPVGSKWQIYIPAKHAYGERGVGTDIGPNELLTFDVELLDIKK